MILFLAKQKDKKRDSIDLCVDEDDDDKDDDKDDDELMLAPFPTKGVNMLLNNKYIVLGRDPRGVKSNDGQSLPHDYCRLCKCKKTMCHDKRFGLYCGLRVAEEIKKLGLNNVNASRVKDLLKIAYNEILRVETVQQIGVLDTYNNYDTPQCMNDTSLKNIMRHFLYQKFTGAMDLRLQDGSMGEYEVEVLVFIRCCNKKSYRLELK